MGPLQRSYTVRLTHLVNHSHRLKTEVALEQNFVEHLHKYFAMRTFGHLKQLFADNWSDNFLVTLEVCNLCHEFLI